MISFFRCLVVLVFSEIERKSFPSSIFRPEFAVKALGYLGLIILLSACARALPSGRSVTTSRLRKNSEGLVFWPRFGPCALSFRTR